MERFDWVVVGSGFGGSVCALRLIEKGYSVLVIEKGRRFSASDFPRTNWDLRNWMWAPRLGLRGFFEIDFFEHLTVAHGVGVGGGSLTYANTLPVPGAGYFDAPSWAHLADWRRELAPHYRTAQRMLGAIPNPRDTFPDAVIREIAAETGRAGKVVPADVGVFFGAPGVEVDDPYFGGRGPRRTGCTFCGACMTGCRVGAKNTLDRNYLYLAESGGARVRALTEVVAVRPSGGGYEVATRPSFGGSRARSTVRAERVVFAGGVLGTVPLLLALRADRAALPALSPRVGDFVRSNSEALVAVVAPESDADFTRGVAITSIFETDEHSHFEPVRYGRGSDFLRVLTLPYAPAPTLAGRLYAALRRVAGRPRRWAKALATRDISDKTITLAYMQSIEGTLRLRLRGKRLITEIDDPARAPTPFLPESNALVERFAEKVGGVPMAAWPETLRAVPSTAHILGGACMGRSADEGVIDARHRVHGYDALYVIDGSAVSANPGVNPSLSITALAERAMSFVPPKGA